MRPSITSYSPTKEGRILLAIHAIQNDQISSYRRAAKVYNIPRSTLIRRLKGITPKRGSRDKNNLLLPIEEEELVRWILSMERRGFPPYIIDVKRLAERLIARRGSRRSVIPIGKQWIYRFLTRHPAIKTRQTRSKDSQRARQERASVIQPWFDRVKDVKERYGIVDGDTYNFDETGFAMGIISGSHSAKVVGSIENVGRATISEPGDRTWVTTIECINADGTLILPFIIVAGKVHL